MGGTGFFATMLYPILWTFLFLCAAFVAAVLELFLPSAGLFGVLSLAFLIASIVFSFYINVFFGGFYTLFVCLLVPVFLWGALRLWPNTWIGRRILLEPGEDPALAPDKEQQSLKQLVGKQGIAKSKMLLGGQIEIEGSRYKAVSDAEPIESGEPVNVIRIEGTCVIVRKMHLTKKTDSSADPAPIEDPFATDQ